MRNGVRTAEPSQPAEGSTVRQGGAAQGQRGTAEGRNRADLKQGMGRYSSGSASGPAVAAVA